MTGAQEQKGQGEKLLRGITKNAARAITDFGMVEDGDLIMVCLSGGKDSYTLLDVLLQLQRRAPVRFELVAVNLDQGQPDFPKEVLPRYLSELGVPHHMVYQDTHSVVQAKVPAGKVACSLCSRLRRGALYAQAKRLGANKVALGHHRDDILQTFFLNMFYGARLKAMPPKLRSDDGEQVLIRPLAYVAESDIAAYAQARAFPIIPCNLCGTQPNLQRQVIGQMLREWEEQQPDRLDNILRSLAHVTPSHLLDRELHDFAALPVEERAGGNEHSGPAGTAASRAYSRLKRAANGGLFPVKALKCRHDPS